MRKSNRNRRRGGSVLEMSFFLPWFVFLFVGAFDWGYYAHALISVQAAARAVALYSSQDSSKTVANSSNDINTCRYAIEELRIAPNITSTTTCTTLPVIVSYRMVSGPDSADGQPAAEAAVTYQTIPLIPIPGQLKNQATIRRVVQMRMRG